MFQEFKAFLSKGNVFDLAVGIVIGAAFGKIVNSLVNDVLMPPIGLIIGRVDFRDLYINLSATSYPSLAEAKAAGAPTIAYGVFLNTILEFVIVGFAIFILMRYVNRMRAKPEAAPDTQTCMFCRTSIPLGATRCPNCTSELKRSLAQP
jgi:large conductance mechanosensitive channel